MTYHIVGNRGWHERKIAFIWNPITTKPRSMGKLSRLIRNFRLFDAFVSYSFMVLHQFNTSY